MQWKFKIPRQGFGCRWYHNISCFILVLELYSCNFIEIPVAFTLYLPFVIILTVFHRIPYMQLSSPDAYLHVKWPATPFEVLHGSSGMQFRPFFPKTLTKLYFNSISTYFLSLWPMLLCNNFCTVPIFLHTRVFTELHGIFQGHQLAVVEYISWL